jgi:hypothetical protein
MRFEEVIEIEASFGKDSIRWPGSPGWFEKTKFIGIEFPGVKFFGNVKNGHDPIVFRG